MNDDRMRGLLHDGVPTLPPQLMTPPLQGIRRRAHRRRLATGAGMAAALLVTAGIAMQMVQMQSAPVVSAVSGLPQTWDFAVVGIDDRSLTAISVRNGSDGPCPEGSLEMPSAGPVQTRADRVVLPAPVPAIPAQANCAYGMKVHLDAPLGARSVVNSDTNPDDSTVMVLHERILPRPSYPAGISRDPNQGNVVLNAPRPAWVVTYSRPDGLTITVSAIPQAFAPQLPVQERLKAHGHDMQIHQILPDKNNIVSWTAEGWQVSVTADPADHSAINRDELQRIIDGLVWP